MIPQMSCFFSFPLCLTVWSAPFAKSKYFMIFYHLFVYGVLFTESDNNMFFCHKLIKMFLFTRKTEVTCTSFTKEICITRTITTLAYFALRVCLTIPCTLIEKRNIIFGKLTFNQIFYNMIN